MRRRSRAREFVLQILYQIDITHDGYDAALANFWQGYAHENLDKSIIEFTDSLVKGVMENLKSIDSKISQYAMNWQLERMTVVDLICCTNEE